MPALADIYQAVRELSFDRFPVPIFVMKEKAGHTITNNNTQFVISNGVNPVLTVTYSTLPTNEQLAATIIQGSFPIAYLGNFKGSIPNSDLVYFTTASIANKLTILRKYYYSDADIYKVLRNYVIQILKYEDTITQQELEDVLDEMDTRTTEHLILWCAIMEVDERRMADFAGSLLTGYFTDGSGSVMSGGLNAGNVWNLGDSVNVQIGGVFNLTDQEGNGNSYSGNGANPSLAGADNVLEDWASFWWKVFLWLRDKMEQKFGDYTFRSTHGMFSDAKLERPLNYRTYFDSYPFTLSPLTRNIIT